MPATEPCFPDRPEAAGTAFEVSLDARALASIRDHCRAQHPAEACGALLGSEPGSVEVAIPLENQAADPARGYLIPADRVRRLDFEAAGSGLEVIGFFHSHPTGSARPSAADLEAALPGYLYLVVAGPAVAPPLRAWRLAPGRDRFDEGVITMRNEQ